MAGGAGGERREGRRREERGEEEEEWEELKVTHALFGFTQREYSENLFGGKYYL